MSEPDRATDEAVGATPPPHALLRPQVLWPFLLTALIWGSTWYVITGQIGDVPASWSVAWRFALAAPCMFALAAITGKSLRLGSRGHLLSLALGLFQFCGNFNFVYRAELHLTSGIVAVMFGMLMVPNAVLGRVLLGERVTPRFFLGSLVAIAGIALLLVHEARLAPLDGPLDGPMGGDVTLGIWLTLGGILAASIANVIQAGRTGRALPMMSLLAWAMLYGALIDFAFAWITSGPPVFPDRWSYWGGIAYLAIVGSVITFPLYYQIVRDIGAGRAAYNGVAVIVIAMLISTFIEGYQWSALAVSGAVLALGGMIVALRARHH
ncbi:MAG: EamA family transporter [Erythrobacter sp.]|nr:EamA family transporter [Erythrobacter sp.]